jgi:hypothetical protein
MSFITASSTTTVHFVELLRPHSAFMITTSTRVSFFTTESTASQVSGGTERFRENGGQANGAVGLIAFILQIEEGIQA